MRPFWASLVFSLSLLVMAPSAAEAEAEAAFILHATDTGSVDRGARESADRGVRRALEEAGLSALGAREDPESLGRDLFDCVNSRCVRGVLGALGADVAVIVALWVDEQSERPVELTVTLIDGSEREPNARLDLEAASDLDEAARTATREALASWSDEWTLLVVEGSPFGAAVSIDGLPVGTLPLRHPIRVGEVDLSVSRAGYLTERLHARVNPGPAGSHRIHIALEPAPERPPRERRWTAGAISLAVLGAGAVTVGAVGLARAGCEAENAAGDCLLESEVRALPVAALTAVGLAAIGASVAWVVRHRRRSGRETAVELSSSRLRIRTRF